MKKSIFQIVFAVLGVSIVLAPSASAAPDFSDTWIPQLISANLGFSSQVDGNNLLTFLDFEIKARINKNSVSSVDMHLMPTSWIKNGGNDDPLVTPCGIGNLYANSSNTYFATTNRQIDSDKFIETYKFRVVIANKDLCGGDWNLQYILLKDSAGHEMGLVNSFLPPKGAYLQSNVWTSKPEVAICRLIPYTSVYEQCYNKFDISMPIGNFDKAAADKAAADKAAADKAAADKAAADKAAADKAAEKPIATEKIIVCIKGKSSLKVIGKSPKCPVGYKKK